MMAPMSGGGGAMMAPMSGGSSIGGMPPLMPNVVSPAGHHPHHHHHQAQAAYPQQASPMGSWGFPTNAATSLQAPLQPAVLHQPHQPHSQHHQQGIPMPMQPQPVYQPQQQQHPSMQPQAPFSLGGPPGSQGPYGHHLPSPLQPTPVGGHPAAAAGWNATAAQHQQHLAYGGSGGLHYASPPTSHGSGGSPSHSSYSSPPSSTSSSSTTSPSPSPSSTSTMMASGVGFGYGGGVGVGVGSAGGGNGSFRLDEAQERMRQQHEQIRAEERLKQQQLHVKMLQEEQQRHLREEQERERIEAEKRKAEREALRQEEERKRLEAQREQERQQEALRAEQMRIFEEVRQAQLRQQHEQELQHQRQQQEQFEQQQKMIQEQQRQQEQLRLERIRFEEEQRREEEAARLQQERVKQEEERKRQDLLRQEQLRQEQFALEQKRREDALQEKRRQEQLLLAQQEKLRREQEEVEQEKLRAEQRLNSERMQQEKERLAEEVRQQQERLRLAQEEIQREKEKMAIELMREQQRIQEERQRLQAEHEKLRQERMERERLEEESRVRHQERVRQHQEQLARQQEAIRQQQQQQVAHLRQQQEQMMRSQAQAQAQPQPQPQPQVSRTQTAPILSRRPTPQAPPVPTNASSWSPFGPTSAAAEERPGEMKPRPRASVGSAILSRPPPHGSGTGSPNKASTLDSPFGGTSAAGGGGGGGRGGSAIHQRPISPPNAAQQVTRHPRKPRHPGAPAPIGALPGSQERQIQADAMASYEAYAAEIARKHRVSDRAEIMTADTMFDSSAFENKLDLYEDHNEQRSAYYDDSSDDENGFYNGNKRSETNPPQPRSGSILGVRSPQQQQPAGRTLISHKTGPAATSGSAVPPKRVPKPIVALRTGPAGAPSHWEKDAGVVKAKDIPGARPLPCVPGDHNRRRSTGSAEGEDGDDDDNNNEKNEGNAEKKGGLRALVKHHTGALKRSPRAPIYNDTEQQPPPQQHPRSAGFSHLNASVDSAHALIEELQEVTGHKEEGQPRSAPLPRAVRQLPTPSHTSPPPATPPRSASKSLPPVPVKNPPTAAGRQLPPKKAPLPPVPRKALSREEAALIFQTRWRSSRMRRQYTQITLRTRVAREIYSSELVYVQSLGVTIDVFLKPLRRAAEQSKPIILSADIASVFGNLEEIYAYHLQMVSKLESRITRWNIETQIGDTFLDMKQDFIMLYSSYINHYDQALETIGRCKDLKTWRAFIQRCNQHPECGGLSLESFLILPVQRVTRYVILLRDLRQKTPENHVDYQNINAAQTYMDNICYQVNENKRSAENLKKQMDVLASLQAKMKPKDMVRDLVDQNRVFVKQVVVTLYDQDSDKRREVCLFVFNDQLLVTKGDIKKDRFQIIAKFTRDDINFRLEIMADTDDFMGQQIKNAFVLHTPRVSYLFFCISAEERNLLFEQIRSIFR